MTNDSMSNMKIEENSGVDHSHSSFLDVTSDIFLGIAVLFAIFIFVTTKGNDRKRKAKI